ncbi:hypothetical protein PMIN06_007683 [Paraphaeosphaeria minitans]
MLTLLVPTWPRKTLLLKISNDTKFSDGVAQADLYGWPMSITAEDHMVSILQRIRGQPVLLQLVRKGLRGAATIRLTSLALPPTPGPFCRYPAILNLAELECLATR